MCIFIVSKVFLISNATVIVSPFATVLINVCSAVTVECCDLYPCCVGVFGMFAGCYVRKKALLQCLCNY